MDYKKALDNLREQVFATTPQEVLPKASFISKPLQITPLPDREVGYTKSSDWLKIIRQSSEDIKSSYKTSPASAGGFSAGLAKGVTNALVKQQEVPVDETVIATPTDKEGFIKRRGSLPSAYAPMDSNAASFVELTDKTEGGGDYNTLFGFSNKNRYAAIKVSEMTIGELKKFAAPSGDYGQWVKGQLAKSGQKARVATPMGRYQFVGTTLAAVANKMGLSDDTVFDGPTQDAMFLHYLSERIASSSTMAGKVEAVRNGWEGYRSVPSSTLERLIKDFEAK